MLIAKSAVDEYLHRDLYSTLWVKKKTRREMEELIRSLPVRPEFKTDPWDHQLACFYLGATHRSLQLQLDMGLGKTKIISDVISWRKRRNGTKRWLVAVPRLVNQGTWREDVALHTELTSEIIPSCTVAEKREALASPSRDLTVIDFAGLSLALTQKKKRKKKDESVLQVDHDLVAEIARRYDGLVVDELHKMGGLTSLWFRVLLAIRKRVPFALTATGTPFGHSPEDLFPQFKITDLGETFGENVGLFRAAFFEERPNRWKHFSVDWRFRKSEWRTLYQWMSNRSIRYSEDECLDLPPLIKIDLPMEPTPEQRKHYNDIIQGKINLGTSSADVDSKFVRMRQVLSGYLVWRDERYDDLKREAYFSENPKMEGLLSILESMPTGDKILIFCIYRSTVELISRALNQWRVKHLTLYSGSKDDPLEVESRFRKDPKITAVVANVDSGGTGANFQVATWMYIFESPTDPRDYKQMVKRAHRGGQTKAVRLVLPYIRKSIDTKIREDIDRGEDLFQKCVNGRERIEAMTLL